jgi:hypothetical protein
MGQSWLSLVVRNLNKVGRRDVLLAGNMVSRAHCVGRGRPRWCVAWIRSSLGMTAVEEREMEEVSSGLVLGLAV